VKPYYEKDGITIYHGDCRDILPSLADESVHALVTDPPYGEAMGFDGDESPAEATKLLEAALRLAVPSLIRTSLAAVFWTMRSLDLAIDAGRSCGLLYKRTLSMYVTSGTARPDWAWLPRTQPIVVFSKYLKKPPSAFHEELALYLSAMIEKSGLSRSQIADQLGCDNRLVMKWSRIADPAWCLPTPRFYTPLKAILGLDDRFDELLDRKPAQPSSRDFAYRHDCYVVNGGSPKTEHCAEKPISVVEHLVHTVAQTGETVIDPFMGSGTTLRAAKNLGRRAIGIEIEEKYCEIAVRRLAQEVLFT
jgi:site-specific DNA-methyltransferase (adenine-specific)